MKDKSDNRRGRVVMDFGMLWAALEVKAKVMEGGCVDCPSQRRDAVTLIRRLSKYRSVDSD